MILKKLLIVILFLSYLSSLAGNVRIEELKIEADKLKKSIKQKSDSLSSIEMEILELETDEFLKDQDKDDGYKFEGIVRNSVDITETDVTFSKVVGNVKKGQKVTLLDYVCGSYLIECGTTKGYILDSDLLSPTDEMLDFIADCELKHEMNDFEKKEESLRKELNKKFSKEITEKLINGYYWIGMTDIMALISLGAPDKTNRTVGTWGVKEQWIYRDNDLYLYFKNGKLESYRNSR